METREIFWNIAHPGWMYVLTLLALLVFFLGLYGHLRFWREGRRLSGTRPPFLPRLRSFLSQAFFHSRVLKKRSSGLMHLFIFWGFLILLIGTLLIALQQDFLGPFFGLFFLHGPFYVIYSFLLDLFGLLALLGTGGVLARRYFPRGSRIRHWPDGLALWLFFAVLVTGFLTEAMRIAATRALEERFSPVGFLLARLFTDINLPTLKESHALLWWGHLILALGMIALIPYTRLFHLLSVPLFMISDPREARGVPAPVFSEPLRLSPDRLTRFSRPHLIGLDACTQCRRCEEVCPVAPDSDGFSPMRMMDELRKGLRASRNDLGLLKDKGSVGRIWECLTCLSCEEQCPVSLPVTDQVAEVRRHRVMALSRFPSEIIPLFRNLEIFGDPFGMGGYAREEWIQGEGARRKLRGGKGILVWMGCQLAFHDRSRKVAGSFLKLLEGLNIDFTLLGKEETCCGDLARRLGNEYLSRKSVSKNIETFRKYGIQKIVTLCPHCFHAFKDEYPPWGGEVLHYTQFLAKLMEGGALSVPSLLDQKVAYHDSCYLGRYHQIYEEPRSILKRIVKGEAIEMVRNRAASLCCGGGGGGFWMRGNWGERINRKRIKEARDRGAQILSTSCPYCLVMLEEAIRSQEIKGLEVMDLIEVIDRLRS